jgi:hypothetical protein
MKIPVRRLRGNPAAGMLVISNASEQPIPPAVISTMASFITPA